MTYLSFNVANPINAKIIAIIQKRMTIVDSAHPFFFKMMMDWSHLKNSFSSEFKRYNLNNY